MFTNTEILLKMVDEAEDRGLSAEYHRNLEFPEVLDGVQIGGKYIENEDHEYEWELAKEAQRTHDGDVASANNYYYG